MYSFRSLLARCHRGAIALSGGMADVAAFSPYWHSGRQCVSSHPHAHHFAIEVSSGRIVVGKTDMNQKLHQPPYRFFVSRY